MSKTFSHFSATCNWATEHWVHWDILGSRGGSRSRKCTICPFPCPPPVATTLQPLNPCQTPHQKVWAEVVKRPKNRLKNIMVACVEVLGWTKKRHLTLTGNMQTNLVLIFWDHRLPSYPSAQHDVWESSGRECMLRYIELLWAMQVMEESANKSNGRWKALHVCSEIFWNNSCH